MSDKTEILLKLFTSDHGPSAAGISHYSSAYSCARKVRMNQASRAMVEMDADDEAPAILGAPETKPIATKVGTFYHLLMEAMIRGQLGEDLVFDARTSVFTPSQQEALRLFRGWRGRWGSPAEKYGMEFSLVEHGLGDTDGPVTALLGAPLTGRLDAGGIGTMASVARTFASTGILLPSVGAVGIDWKSSLTMGKNDASVYEIGLQGSAYLWMYNQQHPETPMVAMIFDKIARHKVLEEKSFAHYVVYPNPDAEAILRNYVQGGVKLLAEQDNQGHASAGNCVDWKSGYKCYFLDHGCRRY